MHTEDATATILVADNNPTSRAALVAELRAHGHTVHEAAEGSHAVATVQRIPVDLVVVPTSLPGAITTLYEAIQAFLSPLPVPFVLLSADVTRDAETVARLAARGSVFVLPRTPAGRELTHAVAGLLRAVHRENGTFEDGDLDHLVSRIQWEAETGTLSACTENVLKKAFFSRGKLAFCASNDPYDPVTRVLLDEGRITHAELEAALDGTAWKPGAMAELMRGFELCARERSPEDMEDRVRESFLELFRWQYGSWSYAGGATARPVAPTWIRIDAQTLREEGGRRTVEAQAPVAEAEWEPDPWLDPSAEASLDGILEQTSPGFDPGYSWRRDPILRLRFASTVDFATAYMTTIRHGKLFIPTEERSLSGRVRVSLIIPIQEREQEALITGSISTSATDGRGKGYVLEIDAIAPKDQALFEYALKDAVGARTKALPLVQGKTVDDDETEKSVDLRSQESERRVHHRISFGGKVELWIGTEGVSASCIDLGEGGLSLRAEAPLAQGLRVAVRVPMPDGGKPLRATAKVAWARQLTNGGVMMAGLVFKRHTGTDARRLSDWVERSAILRTARPRA